MQSNYCSRKKTQRDAEKCLESISAFAYRYQKCLEICCEHMEVLIKTRTYILHKGLCTDVLNLQRQLKDVSDRLDRLQAAAVTVTISV